MTLINELTASTPRRAAAETHLLRLANCQTGTATTDPQRRKSWKCSTIAGGLSMSPEGILVANQAIPDPTKRMQAAVNKSWPKFFVRLANNNAGRKSTK
jgi:hypothetical protein